ncbi:MAG: hypothetical protein KBT06_06585 [Prevotellaceae bacterium]|nr:hypothetical protein [Candidatus Colivivens equi]
MAYVYAIVRDPNNPKSLTKIQEWIKTPSDASDYELCKFFDYATSLSNAFSSCIPAINVETLRKNSYIRQQRMEPLGMERTIMDLRSKHDVVAISHRFGGFTHFDWNFGENISFHIYTNFGYGSMSDFNSTFKYKDVILAPYSYYVKYKNSDYASVTRCTYCYELEYSEWDKVMSDSLTFYNAVVNQDEHYVFFWLKSQLEEMVSTLENFLTCSNYYIYDEWMNRPIGRISSQTYINGNDFWIIKSQKIANSLEFVDNIKILPIQISSEQYITRLINLCIQFVPKLEDRIAEQQKIVDDIQERYNKSCSDYDYQLYKRIYDKYYYKRFWYSKSKFHICWFLLHMLKHKKSNYNVQEIRNHFLPLSKKIDEVKQISLVLSDAYSFRNTLSASLRTLNKRIKDFEQTKDK